MKIAGPAGRVARLVDLVGPLVWSSALLSQIVSGLSARYAARWFTRSFRQLER
jgi:hypothetical protein